MPINRDDDYNVVSDLNLLNELAGQSMQKTMTSNNSLLEQHRKMKCALFEPLVPDRVTVAVPMQYFNAIGTLVSENEKMPRQWVLPNDILRHRCQAVEAATHVRGARTQKHPHRRRQTQHERPSSTSTSRNNVSASKPGKTRTRRSPFRITSIAWRSGLPSIAATPRSGITRTSSKSETCFAGIVARSRCPSSLLHQ